MWVELKDMVNLPELMVWHKPIIPEVRLSFNSFSYSTSTHYGCLHTYERTN
jgi:hypothetical protein